MTLQGKNALVIGSSRGIGRGIAFKLAESGARVAIHYVQNEAAAKNTLAEVCKRGGSGFIVQADVTKPEQIKAMFKRVAEEFGTLDIFVSNARPEAAEFFQAPMDITLEQWDTAFDSQAKAFLVGVREATPLMKRGGKILAITYAEGSRTGGLQPWVGMGSAKAALESLVRYFGVALAKKATEAAYAPPKANCASAHVSAYEPQRVYGNAAVAARQAWTGVRLLRTPAKFGRDDDGPRHSPKGEDRV